MQIDKCSTPTKRKRRTYQNADSGVPLNQHIRSIALQVNGKFK